MARVLSVEGLDEQHLADLWRLARMGHAGSAALFEQARAALPETARLAVAYAESCRSDSATVNKAARKVITKAIAKNHDYLCLHCSRELDKGERFCPECGTQNPGYTMPVCRSTPTSMARAARPSMVRGPDISASNHSSSPKAGRHAFDPRRPHLPHAARHGIGIRCGGIGASIDACSALPSGP
jgi:hypothetical protein